MKKIIIICIGIVIAVGIGLFVVFNLLTPASRAPLNTHPSSPNTTTPNTTSSQPASGNTFSVAAADGGTILTKDFKKDPSTGQYPSAGYYYLGYHAPVDGVTDSTAIDNPPYIIVYLDSTQYFNIELLQTPLGAARTQAEEYLTLKLGISQNDMCRLKYNISVPSSVDPDHAGTNLGFSFCPGAVTLP